MKPGSSPARPLVVWTQPLDGPTATALDRVDAVRLRARQREAWKLTPPDDLHGVAEARAMRLYRSTVEPEVTGIQDTK